MSVIEKYKLHIEPVGECAILLRFADKIDESLPPYIARLAKILNHNLTPAPINAVPSYTTLFLEFSVLEFDYTLLHRQLHSLTLNSNISQNHALTNTIEIPVYYGEEVALDATRFSKEKGLSLQQLQEIHTCAEYQVHALGFAPGFAFMAETPKSLQLPRLDSPRPIVAKGSVAIAGPQTAVYPEESPGGWNIIGRTPIELYSPQQQPMTLLSPGDTVRFTAISKRLFIELGGKL
ncbi:allophanate hydrolase [Vibrio inusitatus NBRC 102082]|uniref:Allophanate hydrolase n=1 Tax=Vibrio inusitatus NBRC 102082 TaxID=1219070 RepID=A0A4Y3HTU7_9VIBR|nr:5-oxoprolinase subunit PxpB [Vibrio inusitatus]GEA50391.1 allophanate hydrolase [Vibrio inusitatus NBRC 102082]